MGSRSTEPPDKENAIMEEWRSFVGQKVVDGEMEIASSMGKLTPVVVEFVQRFLSDNQKVLSSERRDRLPSGNALIVDPAPTTVKIPKCAEIPVDQNTKKDDAELEDYFNQLDLDGRMPKAAPPIGILQNELEQAFTNKPIRPTFHKHESHYEPTQYTNGQDYEDGDSHWERFQRRRDAEQKYSASSSRATYNGAYDRDDDADSLDTMGYADVREDRNDFGRSAGAIQNNVNNLRQPGMTPGSGKGSEYRDSSDGYISGKLALSLDRNRDRDRRCTGEKDKLLILFGDDWPEKMDLFGVRIIRFENSDLPCTALDKITHYGAFAAHVEKVVIISNSIWAQVSEDRSTKAANQFVEVFNAIRRRCPKAQIRLASIAVNPGSRNFDFYNRYLRGVCEKYGGPVKFIDSISAFPAMRYGYDGMAEKESMKSFIRELSYRL